MAAGKLLRDISKFILEEAYMLDLHVRQEGDRGWGERKKAKFLGTRSMNVQ